MPRTSLFGISLLSVLVTAHTPLAGRGEDWPCWRGPRGDGTSLESGIPVHWDGPTGKNIAWKVPIPATGHASPIVWKDRVFVAGCREERQERILLCLDRKTGKILWQRVATSASLVSAEGLVHFLSDDGVTTVVRPDPKFQVVARNRLREDCRGMAVYQSSEKQGDV
jgi:outer membrane protein assembly factor BamB